MSCLKKTVLFSGVLAEEEDGAGTDLGDGVEEGTVAVEVDRLGFRKRTGGAEDHDDVRHGRCLRTGFIDLDLGLVDDVADMDGQAGHRAEIGVAREGFLNAHPLQGHQLNDEDKKEKWNEQ